MNPKGRADRNIEPQREANHHRANNQCDKGGRAIAHIKARKVERALRAGLGKLQHPVKQAARTAPRA